jgi:hypothetical protein
MTTPKLLDPGEFIVAIKTGINYWHILTGREYMQTAEEAEEYADCFNGTYPTAVLRVHRVTNIKD